MKVIDKNSIGKKAKYYVPVLLLALVQVFCVSCEDDSVSPVLSPSASTGQAQLSNSILVLDQDMSQDTVLMVQYNEPELGFSSGVISYRLQLDLDGNGFSAPLTIDGGTELQIYIQGDALNGLVLDLGAEPGQMVKIAVRVETVLSKDSSFFSEPSTFSVTAFSSRLDLSSVWGLVGDATPNGWDGPDQPFYKTQEPNEFVAYVTLGDGAIKIRENNEWEVNYGDTGLDGSLELDGENIAVTAGTYRVWFNSATLTYTLEEYAWGVVGSATPNGWNGPDIMLEYDPFSDQWRSIINVQDGEIKIRANNAWLTSYGDADSDGTLDTDDDNNISVSAGNYILSVNFNNLNYTLEPIENVWGLVGSAYNDWGATPDAEFKRDWSVEGEVWKLEEVSLSDGQFKIRANNEWEVSYGDVEPDGILDTEEDNNIDISAGVYTIRLDFSNPQSPEYYIMEK